MNTRDWNWYYSNPAKAADKIESLHALLWAIIDDLPPHGRLSAKISKRVELALDGIPRPAVSAGGQP